MGLRDDAEESRKIGVWDHTYRLDAIEEQIAWHREQAARHRACQVELEARHRDICYPDGLRFSPLLATTDPDAR